MIKLYYYPSYASMVPHMLMEEIGLDYELVFTDRYANAHKSEAFLRLNPNGLIPVFEEGDLVLYETAAICLHLVDRHLGACLAPAIGTADRAHFYKWLMWLATALHPALSMYLHPDTWASDRSVVTQLKASAEAKVSDSLNVIDAELGKRGGPWLLGDAYCAVDPYALMVSAR